MGSKLPGRWVIRLDPLKRRTLFRFDYREPPELAQLADIGISKVRLVRGTRLAFVFQVAEYQIISRAFVRLIILEWLGWEFLRRHVVGRSIWIGLHPLTSAQLSHPDGPSQSMQDMKERPSEVKQELTNTTRS